MAFKTILCTYIELSESPFGWTALYYIGKIHRACYYPSYLLDKNSYNIFINANCKTKINLVYLHNNTFIFVHPNSPSFVKDSLLWRVVGYRRTSPFIYFNTRPILYDVFNKRIKNMFISFRWPCLLTSRTHSSSDKGLYIFAL